MTALPHATLFDRAGAPAETSERTAPVRVSVHRDVAAVLDLWAELEASVPHSIYQSRKWLIPWLETIGADQKIEPVFVVLRDRFQLPVGLLPLGIRRHGPVRIASFLGGKDSNFNMGLLRPELTMSPKQLVRVLRDAARQLGAGAPALYALLNQPTTWEGAANLLTILPSRPSPSAAYETTLPADADAFAGRLSKDTRKKLRRKESRLAELAPVRHVHAADDQTARTILAAFFDQKAARLRCKQIASDVVATSTKQFFKRAGAPSRDSAIEVHALYVGQRIVATFCGSTYRGRVSGMVNSFDGDPEIARSSPGDLLLTKVIAAACAAGIGTFDLGIGAARYKTTFCETAVPLVDCLVAASLPGRVIRVVGLLTLRAKRAAKQNPRVGRAFDRLRRLGARR